MADLGGRNPRPLGNMLTAEALTAVREDAIRRLCGLGRDQVWLRRTVLQACVASVRYRAVKRLTILADTPQIRAAWVIESGADCQAISSRRTGVRRAFMGMFIRGVVLEIGRVITPARPIRPEGTTW